MTYAAIDMQYDMLKNTFDPLAHMSSTTIRAQ